MTMDLPPIRPARNPLRVAVALMFSTITAAASAQSPTEDARHNHAMGSQIRLHEGVFGFDVVPEVSPLTSVKGMDVSSYQGNVNWSTAYASGARFAYIKATEGNYYTNSYFAQQYNGSYSVGMIRGAYHFANPSSSSGANQAQYFVSHGGGWSADGKTLPGALDIEWDPYGSACYGLSQSAMASWINDFANTYHSLTTRWPVIYTANSWWSQCVGTHLNLSSTDPLWVASYASSVGTLPYPWTVYTFWQYADTGTFPGDQDVFNGSYYRLKVLAK